MSIISPSFLTRAAPALALLSPMLLAACGHAEADPRTEPPLVRTATAGTTVAGGESFTGVVSSRVQSDLGFRVAGKVVARLVDTGQVVRRGQPLMRIDATDYVLAARQSQGAVAAARATAIQTAADEKRYRDLVSAGAIRHLPTTRSRPTPTRPVRSSARSRRRRRSPATRRAMRCCWRTQTARWSRRWPSPGRSSLRGSP